MPLSKTDIANQEMLEEFVNDSPDFAFKLTPYSEKFALLDGYCQGEDGKMVGMYECRHRYTLTNEKFVGDYKGMSLIGLKKWQSMRIAAQISGMPIYLIYGMRDAIYCRKVIFDGGRDCVPFRVCRVPSQRDSDELCAEIPMNSSDRVA